MLIDKELAADAQHHRPVPSNQRGEGGLAGRAAPAGRVPLQKLAIGKPGDRAFLEERSSCRITDPDAPRAIPDRSLVLCGCRNTFGQPGGGVGLARRSRTARHLFIPAQGTVLPPVNLSRF